MRKKVFALGAMVGFFFTSCDLADDDTIAANCIDGIKNGIETGVDCGGSCTPCASTVVAPATYVFTRDGNNTVSFSGQTTRLKMGDEILSAFKDTDATEQEIKAMYAHIEGAADFTDAELNASNKSVKSKTAASTDYFSTNATDQALIRADFDGWITAQVEEVFPNWNTVAVAGTPGQIADGASTRYINGKGLEYDQLFNKGLIGAFTVDQILNNYLSPAVLDEADNRANNDASTPIIGESYTTMEHKWDEAYGYAYGLNEDPADPNVDLGADSFLNKYIGRVAGDDDFNTIALEIFEAFKLGRAAIVAKDYTLRDIQANIIKERISEVIGIRAVYYLQQGKNLLNQDVPNYGAAFHDFSEGYGFIYSLQFTRKPNSDAPYFTKTEVDAFLVDLLDDGANGLWDVAPATLESMAIDIAARFNFTLAAASE